MLQLANEIQKLEAYNNSSFPILSVYLTISKDKELRQNFKELIAKNLTYEQQEIFERDILYMDGFLQKYRHSGNDQGIAMFAGDDQIVEFVHTYLPLPNLVKIDHSPFLEPILKELSIYRRYLVIVAGRRTAKFFTIYLDTLESQKTIKDDSVPQDIKGRSREAKRAERTDKIQRHIHERLNQHLNLISKKAEKFINNKPLVGVVVGGHKEIIHELKSHLPKHLQEKIVGKFIADSELPVNELTTKSKKIIKEANEHLNHQEQTYEVIR